MSRIRAGLPTRDAVGEPPVRPAERPSVTVATPVSYLVALTPRVPFIDLSAAHEELGGELEAAVGRVIDSGWYLLGEELEAFEREFASYCGTRYCVGVASGLSALELALCAAGVGPGDEVIVPAYTFVATWLAATRIGACPIGVDVEESTYNIDPERLEAAITPRTVAIIPVHLRGEPADMDAINKIATTHGLHVVEDAAQAHGARHRDRRVGSLAAAAAFSFYPTKNLGALGDGGAVTTDDEELATRVRRLRNYGMDGRYEVEEPGANSRLAEIHAAALRSKLPRLDEWNRRRTTLANVYHRAFAGVDSIVLPQASSWAEPVWHLFFIGHPDRDACARELRARGIETLVHYPVLPHLSGAYADARWERGSFPVAERLSEEVLSLPLYPQLSVGDCEAVAEAVLETVPIGSGAGEG
jgi:dTDP-3-amino-3,4,6-trideoxy-alpha-D-glucose transaminase